MKARKNIFWKQHFTVLRKINTLWVQHLAPDLSRLRSAVTSSAVRSSVRVHFFVTSIHVSSDDQLTIVGTIQATLPCDLETFRCRLTWLGMLALDKTEHKSRSPNRACPRNGLFKVSVLDGPL